MAVPVKTLIALALVGGALAWMEASPPEMIRVGSNYTAKIVCSNVFIAGRAINDVLKDDVQAPGHPLLGLMHVNVDREQEVVHAGMFGFIGGGLAVHRPGTGCAVVPDGNLDAAKQIVARRPSIPAPRPDTPWPQGSGAQLIPAVQAVIEDKDLAGKNVRGVVVIHQGKLVAQRYNKGFTENTPLLGWSMTKSVNAGLVGMQIGAGKMALTRNGLWPTGDEREKITLADLMAMADGINFNEGYGGVSDVTRMLYLEPDMAGYVKSLPLAHPPGSFWNYSSGTSVVLASLWQQAAGDKALDFPYTGLFAPLGMSSAVIEADARGTLVGSSYMYATAQDWARYGQFLLQDGVWNGQRLLPEGFVGMMTTATEPSNGQYAKGQLWRWGPGRDADSGKNPDAVFGLPADTYWMSGHDGQTVAIIPSRQLVVVRMGLTPSNLHYQPQAMIAEVIKALK